MFGSGSAGVLRGARHGAGTGQGAPHPSQAYTARPKAAPPGVWIDIGRSRVSHDCMDPSRVITSRYNSWLHHMGLGRRHAGTRVLVRDRHIRVLDTDGHLLRELRLLDPTRDYQPQAQP